MSRNYASAAPEGEAAMRRQRRRFTVLGVGARLLVAGGILAGFGIGTWMLIDSRPEPIQRRQFERSFTVTAMAPEYGTFSTTYTAFGQIVTGRDIAIRSQVQGEITEVSENLQVGRTVERGELLVAIDSYDYDGALIDAQAALADAQLSLAEAQETLKLQQTKLEAAQTSLDVTQRDYERAVSLNQSGALTDKEVETRELAVSQGRQAVAELETAIFTQNATIDRQRAGILSAQSAVEDARRNLANTRITAPFTGVVQSETARLGAVVATNETVVTLYDPEDLQAAFTISDLQYGRLLSDGLNGRAVTVTWNIDPTPISVEGEISRAGAEIDATTGGVALFARLTGDNAALLRPGTFVEIAIDGPDYENTLRVPETALYENDHFYVVRDGRMAQVDAQIVTRDNDMLIVRAEVPADEKIITSRLNQAGEGVKVTVEGDTGEASDGQGAGFNPASFQPGQLPPGATRRDDGSIVMPNGNIRRPDGSIERPDGTVISAEEAARLRAQRQSGGAPAGPGN